MCAVAVPSGVYHHPTITGGLLGDLRLSGVLNLGGFRLPSGVYQHPTITGGLLGDSRLSGVLTLGGVRYLRLGSATDR